MTTYYVRKSGSDGNSGLTEALAKLTIASAITASTTGDTIDIGVGTWAENINSSRVYRGVSMYKSIISAVTSSWSGLTLTFQYIRVNHITTPNNLGNNLTFSYAMHDLSGCAGAPSTGYYFCATLNGSYSIFRGYAGAAGTRAFYVSTASVISHCIFYDMYGSSYLTEAILISMTNTIYYIASRNTAQAISNGSVAWTLEQYNCFYSALSTFSSLPGGAFGTGTLNDIDPQFRDAVGGDFNLSDSSPSIGKGHA